MSNEDKKQENPTCTCSEATEEIMKFPMEFPIKIMGLTRDDYVATLCNVVRKHYPDFDDSKNTIDYSTSKKYTSLTVTVIAKSKEELDALYMELTKHPFVKVVL